MGFLNWCFYGPKRGFSTSYVHDLLDGNTGGYKGLQGITRGDRVWQMVTGGFKGWQGVTKGLQGVMRGLEEVTMGYKGFDGITRAYRGLERVHGFKRGILFCL